MLMMTSSVFQKPVSKGEFKLAGIAETCLKKLRSKWIPPEEPTVKTAGIQRRHDVRDFDVTFTNDFISSSETLDYLGIPISIYLSKVQKTESFSHMSQLFLIRVRLLINARKLLKIIALISSVDMREKAKVNFKICYLIAEAMIFHSHFISLIKIFGNFIGKTSNGSRFLAI